jgi:hypothetical protein
MSAVTDDDSVASPPLGAPLAELEPEALDRQGRPWRRLLEWSGTSAPVAVLLLAGVALGPRGVALLSSDTLSLLAPAIPVAVAVLGVLVGLSVATGRADRRRVILPACLDAMLTVVVVGAGMAALAFAWSAPVTSPLIVLIAGTGICAASSMTLPTGNPLEPRPAAVRLIEIGVLVPILLGGVMLAWITSPGALPAVAAIAQASGLVCALALAAWLLMTVAANETEERVLTASALLLVGGVSDALATSALFGGVLAGALWRYAGGRALEAIGRNVQFVQHPLLVGLLLTAGASAELSRTSAIFATLYVGVRVVGRLTGTLAMRPALDEASSAHLRSHLLPPGIFGIAFALNAEGVIGADASLLLGTVVLGTIGSELVAFLVTSRRTAG